MKNPLYSAYVKNGLEQLQDEMNGEKIVDLSCTTGILSPLTALVGIRKGQSTGN